MGRFRKPFGRQRALESGNAVAGSFALGRWDEEAVVGETSAALSNTYLLLAWSLAGSPLPGTALARDEGLDGSALRLQPEPALPLLCG